MFPLSFQFDNLEKYLLMEVKESRAKTEKGEVKLITVLSLWYNTKNGGITLVGSAWSAISRNFCRAFLTTSCSLSSVVVLLTFIRR